METTDVQLLLSGLSGKYLKSQYCVSQSVCALASNWVKLHFNLLEMLELSAKDWIPSGPAPAVVQRCK